LKGLQLQKAHHVGRPKKGLEKSTDLSPLATLGLKPAESKRMHAAARLGATPKTRGFCTMHGRPRLNATAPIASAAKNSHGATLGYRLA
jgi:hypothetical protein